MEVKQACCCCDDQKKGRNGFTIIELLITSLLLGILSTIVVNSFGQQTRQAREREAIQALIDQTQKYVTGLVRVSLYKGNVTVLGRSSEFSLYDAKVVTFEDDENAYNQSDATGFIKINSLRLKQIARRKKLYLCLYWRCGRNWNDHWPCNWWF